MHFLIGLSVLVGLIAFGFGERTAQNAIRVLLAAAGVVLLTAALYVVVDGSREMATYGSYPKVPEDTPEMRRTCAEWRNNPDDAPRMCFAVLEPHMGRRRGSKDGER